MSFMIGLGLATISSWMTSRHWRKSLPKKLAPDARPFQYSAASKYVDVLQGWNWLTCMTNTAASSGFFGCRSNDNTHLTDAVIFGSRTTRCAVASMTLTGSIGLLVSAFLGDLKDKKLRILNERFDGSERLVGTKGYSPGLMQWRVVLTTFSRVSSNFGWTVVSTCQEIRCRNW